MKDFWKKYKIVLTLVGFILIIPPLFCGLSLLMLDSIQMKADMIQEKKIDSELERAKIGKIPEMEKANEDFEKKKDATEVILNANNEVDFIRYIEVLAKETNNKIELKVLEERSGDKLATSKQKKKETTGGKEEKKNIEEALAYKQYISIQVVLNGGYADFLNFIHKLEHNKYYVNILSLDLQKVLLEKDEKSVATEGSAARGVFLSPVRVDKNDSEDEEDKEMILKSTLNMIVYTQ
jgi:hypothetical protein